MISLDILMISLGVPSSIWRRSLSSPPFPRPPGKMSGGDHWVGEIVAVKGLYHSNVGKLAPSTKSRQSTNMEYANQDPTSKLKRCESVSSVMNPFLTNLGSCLILGIQSNYINILFTSVRSVFSKSQRLSWIVKQSYAGMYRIFG